MKLLAALVGLVLIFDTDAFGNGGSLSWTSSKISPKTSQKSLQERPFINGIPLPIDGESEEDRAADESGGGQEISSIDGLVYPEDQGERSQSGENGPSFGSDNEDSDQNLNEILDLNEFDNEFDSSSSENEEQDGSEEEEEEQDGPEEQEEEQDGPEELEQEELEQEPEEEDIMDFGGESLKAWRTENQPIIAGPFVSEEDSPNRI